MSAGKVLALIVVVASFAIVAVAVSWCCWCVRSRFGSDKSIQAVKSVATVADTIDSSRAAKSSLSTFPTTTTTTMPPGPRATDIGPRVLTPAAEVDANAAKQSGPAIPSTILQSAESTRSSPTSADAVGALTGRGTSYATSPLKACYQDEIFRRPQVAESLQRRISKVDLFSCEDTALATAMDASFPAPGTDSVRRRTPAGAEVKGAAGAEGYHPNDSRNKAARTATFASDSGTPSGKDTDTTSTVSEDQRGVPESDRPDLRCKQTGQKSDITSGTGTASQQKSPATDSCVQPSSRVVSGPESPVVASEGVFHTVQQFEGSSPPYQDTLDGASCSARSAQISTALERKNERASRSSKDPTMPEKVTEVSPGFQTPMDSENVEGSKARDTTPRTKRAG
ncbi:uncharacterized protein LOC144105329 [Amblyomma americanum]